MPLVPNFCTAGGGGVAVWASRRETATGDWVFPSTVETSRRGVSTVIGIAAGIDRFDTPLRETSEDNAF